MESAGITHGESLWERLDVLRDAGTYGAKTCSAMASFLKERASLERSYGEALIKASARTRSRRGITAGAGNRARGLAPQSPWAQSLDREGWGGVMAFISTWGKQHVGWAISVDEDIARNLAEFSERHRGHVERLWAEAQELVTDLEVVQGEYYRAKDAYEQACIQATRLLDDRNKGRENAAAAAAAAAAAEHGSDAATGEGTVTAPLSPTRAKEAGAGSMLSSVSKMLEKVGEGVAMAVSKAAGDVPLTELEAKVPDMLQGVDVAESEYIASIMAVNGYTTEFQPEMEAKLKQFKLLEESRIMYTRDVLLRLDQTSRGTLECLLGPGGTLEVLSIALSHVDSVADAQAQVLLVRSLAGLTSSAAFSQVPKSYDSGDPSLGGHGAGGVVTEGSAVGSHDERLAKVAQVRNQTATEIRELSESGVEKAFEGGKEGTSEALRVVQDVCSCLGEVVSVLETHSRDMVRLLCRQGYGSRVANAGVAGTRASIDLHAIGATMEDVGKNVMANMSGSSPLSVCAEAMEGAGRTLTKGWDVSAVNTVLVSVEAHTELAHALADGSCSAAIKMNGGIKATLRHMTKLFAAASKQHAAAKSAHQRAVARHDKLAREARERGDALARAHADLKPELHASGGSSIGPAPVPPPVRADPAPTTPRSRSNSSSLEQAHPSGRPILPRIADGVDGEFARGEGGNSTPLAGAGTGPWVLGSLGLGQQHTSSRVRALEMKVAALTQERDAAKLAVQDAVQALQAALSDLRETVKDIVLASFAEASSRHSDLSQLFDGVLSAWVNAAKAVAADQALNESAKTVEMIDGRRDVEELLERNVHRVTHSGSATRGRVAHGDSIGEVVFMAYHSEVLQQERDKRKKNFISPAAVHETADRTADGGDVGVRRAGGGGHPLFTAMAEAALAQAHAKQQKRQILAKQEDSSLAGDVRGSGSGAAATLRPTDALALSRTGARTDGESDAPRPRIRRRRRRTARAGDLSGAGLSDSEVVMGDDNVSRHGGSLHGLLRRGSRHGSAHGSRHDRSFSRHGNSGKLVRMCSTRGLHVRGDVTHDIHQPGADTFPEVWERKRKSSGEASVAGTNAHERPPSPSGLDRAPTEDGTAAGALESNMRPGLSMAGLSEAGSGSEGAGDEEVCAELPLEGSSSSPALSPARLLGRDGDDSPASGADNGRETDTQINDDGGKTSPSASHPTLEAGERFALNEGGDKVFLSERPAVNSERPRKAALDSETSAESATNSDLPFTEAILEARPAAEHARLAPPELRPQARVSDEAAVGYTSEEAPTEDRMAPVEQALPPAEEDAAPTEESLGPAGGYGVPAAVPSPTVDASSPTNDQNAQVTAREERPPPLEGRPSLHSLRHRLKQQEHFSSDGEEAEDLSSSGDERPSAAPSDAHASERLAFEFDDARPPGREGLFTPRRACEDAGSLSGFDLPVSALEEKVIESYSSALYTSGGLPLHGRLYITAKHALFSGWRNTKVIVPLSEITELEKTSTLRIVINALTIVKRDGERINFGAFLFRDDCYNLLTRLINVSSSISKLRGPPASAGASAGALSPASMADDGFEADTSEHGRLEDHTPEPSETAPGVAFAVSTDPTPTGGLDDTSQLETILDATLPCTAAQAFVWLWGPQTTFWADFLRAKGESSLSVSSWRTGRQRSEPGRGLEDLFPGVTFRARRELLFTHPRAGFVVGPRKVQTKQVQGYLLDRRRNSDGARAAQGAVAPMDRVIVCQATWMDGGAPLADHFTILCKVQMTREPPDLDGRPKCRLVVGFEVAYHKSTMLRGAIRSGAAEETSAAWKAWLLAAEKVVAYQRARLGKIPANEGASPAPPARVLDIARGLSAEDASACSDAERSRSVPEDVVVEQGTAADNFRVLAVAKVAVTYVASIGKFGIAMAKSAGLSNVLMLFCILVVILQQREMYGLRVRMEQLAADMRDIRDRAE